MKQALIIYGGMEGHQPKEVSMELQKILMGLNVECTLVEGLDILENINELQKYNILVMSYTGGVLNRQSCNNVIQCVNNGMGLAGCHAGLCDSFRENAQWHMLVGGSFVGHPGGNITYTVNIISNSNPIVSGVEDFCVTSEQYYLTIDPSIEVLATTRACSGLSDRYVDMPVVWTKQCGKGKIFYCSLGHHADMYQLYPQFSKIVSNGLKWAIG